MLSFGDSSASGADGEDWVETHAGRKPAMDSAANPGVIADIPDLDGDGAQDTDGVANTMGKMSISDSKGAVAAETPDLDDIPDMEEDVEAGDEATAAPKATVPSTGVVDSGYVFTNAYLSMPLTTLPQSSPSGQWQFIASANI
jgi:ubiquitin-like-conjugating enzyme ATG3